MLDLRAMRREVWGSKTGRWLATLSLLGLSGCEIAARFGQLLFLTFAAFAVLFALGSTLLAISVFWSRGHSWGSAVGALVLAGTSVALGSSCTQGFSSASSLTGMYVSKAQVLLWISLPTALSVVLGAACLVALVAFRSARFGRLPRALPIAAGVLATTAALVYVVLTIKLTMATLAP